MKAAWGSLPKDLTIRDTMYLAWLLDENEDELNLRYLAHKHCGITLKGFAAYSTQANLFAKVENIEEKCKQDVIATLALYKTLRARLTSDPALVKVYENLHSVMVKIIIEMESEGCLIHQLPLAKQTAEWYNLAKAAEKSAAESGYPHKLSRPIPLSRYLFEEKGLKPKPFMLRQPDKWRMKKFPLWKVPYDVLLEYKADDPLVPTVLNYRDNYKLARTYGSTWLNSTDGDGRIHTHFWLTGTDSGRLSSSDPINLQNVPAVMRQFIIAPPGRVFVYADYSQLELRLMAHASQDPELLRAYRENQDIHNMTQEAFGLAKDRRVVAKMANFGLIYGIGPHRFQRQIITGSEGAVRPTIDECKRWSERFFAKYRLVRPYHDRVSRGLCERGYVETLLRRKRRLCVEYRRDPDKALRIGINATIQGSGADLIDLGMLAIWNRKAPSTKFLMQVHDSVVLECDEALVDQEATMVRECLEQAAKLTVPLVAKTGIGATLDEAEKAAN